MSLKLKSKATLISAATILATAAFGAYVFHEENRPPILEIYIFALKSGQSIFIRTPEDKRILINGGGNPDVIREITKILPFYSRRIETVIATDDLANNVSGLIDVIDRYNVDTAYVPAITLESLDIASSTDQVYTTLVRTLADKKIETSDLQAGDVIHLDSDVQSEAIFPAPSGAFAYSKASAPEVAFRITFRSTSFTFIGNASKKVQKYIAASSTFSDVSDLDVSGTTSAAVLVVSTSANPDDISAEFIGSLNPQYLVYSKSPTSLSSKSSGKTSKVPKKKAVDPLGSIPIGNRLNVKEKGSVYIMSDGQSVTIRQ